ncbi:MAG: lytic transglycosylase domain-containing protein [Candidatus Rokuibacteriota bacterium]
MQATATLSPIRRRLRHAARVALAIKLLGLGLVAVAVFFAANWVFQVIRKPSALLAPVAGRLAKTPPATWAAYGHLFREHSTDIVSPELLAALAQVEGQGNPVAQTYWVWRLDWNPLEIYRPASSAVGMFQITDGAFAEARRYCIRDHAVVRDGPWHDWRSCWFNSLYTRVVPSHAVELTSAHLHQSVVDLLARRPGARATLEQKQTLAAVVHLCGRQRGEAFVRQGFHVRRGERCGSHDLRAHVAAVRRLKARFAEYARAGS